ncbi:hypothetical protein CRG98_017254 [Punica granatum]|nr:hypothetical protein CRG98_017254 [Punica granatum]
MAIVILVAVVSLLLSSISIKYPRQKGESLSSSDSEAASKKTSALREIHGVKVERSPPQSRLEGLGVSTWPTWSSGPSKFPWTFKSTETMYLVEGKVKVHVVVDGQEEEDWFEIGGGDLVVFPKGMNIVWNVVEAVNKHYYLDKDEDEAEAEPD